VRAFLGVQLDEEDISAVTASQDPGKILRVAR
jgi:hypothetical protein